MSNLRITHQGRIPLRCGLAGLAPVLLIALLTGCDKAKGVFMRATLPDMGPPIPMSVRIDFDPSLVKARDQFTNACNAPQEMRIGEELESVLIQAAYQNFKAVYTGGKVPAGVKPDVEVYLTLQQAGLKIQTDGIYDRLPTDLTLEVLALFKDSSGKVLLEQPIKANRQEKLILEPTQHRCAYLGSEKFLHDAAVGLAVQFVQHARNLLAPDAAYAQAAGPPGEPAPPVQPAPAIQAAPAPVPPQAGPAGLTFKATVLDENNNAVLESGERVKVRVDLINAGQAPAQNVSVSLSGSPAILSQFPATSLPIGTLQPGESRSVEFPATLPPSAGELRGELQVSLAAAGAVAAPVQTVAVTVRPAGTRASAGPQAARSYEDVDRVPASSGLQRPQTHLVAIGLGSYRDQQIPARKYAARDAELVASYFQSLGGVSASNVRVLQDRKALRADIEETLMDWLPPRLTGESVVIVYFAGHAKVDVSGETYLVPYEGSGTSAARLYPVKDLQDTLGKLKARHALLIFDGSVTRLGKDAKAKGKWPKWAGGNGNLVELIGTTGTQPGLEPEQLKHGLFTYHLLRGLAGEADANRDGDVTLGELASFLRQAVPTSAKGDFGQDQRPQILPPLTASSKAAGLTLTRTAR
ncbi:MAG: caspase family protein [Nitrospirota bacterium]